ncbi:MAG: hypothetical protein ACRDQD_25235 [Nocardioidaceae bacterium]
MMETADHDPGRARAASVEPDTADGAAVRAVDVAGERELGAHAPALLAAEHWSLLSARSLIWNEAQSRATVFLTVLSASIIAVALAADASGFGSETTTLALVLLPVVFLLGVAAYVRLVQINTEEFQLVLAMNRVRRAYLTLEPGLERYLTTDHHDDQRGVFVTYMAGPPTRRSLWAYFLVTTPTIVATIDAALAAAIVVLGLQAAEASRAVAVVGGVIAFLLVWAALLRLQLQTLRPFRDETPRFPSPPEEMDDASPVEAGG